MIKLKTSEKSVRLIEIENTIVIETERQRSKPSIIRFGGVSINLGLDYMKYKISGDMEYTKSNDQDFEITDPFSPDPLNPNVSEANVDLTGTLNGSVSLDTNFVAVTPEAFAYLDLFYFLSLYTGPSISFTTGAMEFNVDCSGNLRNDTALRIDSIVPDYVMVPADTEVGSARLLSKNRLTPFWIIPRWTFGFEISILMVNIKFEGSTLLRSPTDSFSGQFGLSVRI